MCFSMETAGTADTEKDLLSGGRFLSEVVGKRENTLETLLEQRIGNCPHVWGRGSFLGAHCSRVSPCIIRM